MQHGTIWRVELWALIIIRDSTVWRWGIISYLMKPLVLYINQWMHKFMIQREPIGAVYKNENSLFPDGKINKLKIGTIVFSV